MVVRTSYSGMQESVDNKTVSRVNELFVHHCHLRISILYLSCYEFTFPSPIPYDCIIQIQTHLLYYNWANKFSFVF